MSAFASKRGSAGQRIVQMTFAAYCPTLPGYSRVILERAAIACGRGAISPRARRRACLCWRPETACGACPSAMRLRLHRAAMNPAADLKLPDIPDSANPGKTYWARATRKPHHDNANPRRFTEPPGVGNPLPRRSAGRGEYLVPLYGQLRFMASMSSLNLRACWARSATAFEASPMACAV